MIKVKALGGTRIFDGDGNVVQLRSRKHVALLLYLLSNAGKVHTRSRLCSLFWTTERNRARHSLSQGLYDLTQTLGPVIRRICGHDICVNARDIHYDVGAFEGAVESEELAAAVGLYSGGFAENLTDAGTSEFERWLDSERTRLARLAEAVLRRHAKECETRGHWGGMCLAAFKLAAIVPFDMSVHSTYMRALWHQGDAAAALSHYESVLDRSASDYLPEEIAEIEALASRIRDNPTIPRKTVEEGPQGINWEPPLVGRDAEFMALQRMVSNIDGGTVSRVIIRGEAGIGKSRLIDELCDSLSLTSVQIVRSRCYQAEEDLPYSPVGDAVKSLATRLSEFELSVGERFPRLSFLVPELRPGEKRQEDRSRVDLEVWRRALYEDVVSMLRLIACRTPLIWIVDDVQWIDRASGALFHYLCRKLASDPFLLLMTVREARDATESSISPLAKVDRTDESVRQLHLRPLAEEHIREIVTKAAAEAREHPARDLAVRLSSGNPYYALEVLAAAVDSEEWAKSASEWDPINDERLRKLLAARLRGLNGERIRLLQVVAVLERFARPRIISEVLGVDLEETAALAELLYTRGLIQDDNSRIAFTNDTMREFIYGEMTTLQRASLHLSAGRTLESQPDATTGALATHFQHGDDWLRSFGYAMEAAKAAQDSAGHSEAAHFASVAVEVAPGCDEQSAALKIWADSSFAAGNLGEAASCYETLLRLPTTDVATRVRTKLQLAHVEICRCNWFAAAKFLKRSQRELSVLEDNDEKISLLATRAELALKLAFLSDDPEAARESEKPINELVGKVRGGYRVSPATAFSVLSTKAIQEAVTGSSEKALAAIEEAEEHLTGTTQYERMRYFSFRGYVRSKLAQWDAAEADLLCSMEAAKTTGDLLARIRLWNNLACLATERGHWSSATDRIEKAAKLQATLEGRSDTSLSIILNRANLCFYQGLLGRAFDLYRQAGELCEADNILGTRLEVHSCLGLIALQRNKLAVAQQEWERLRNLRNREGVSGGTQEGFKYAWFASWMLQNHDSLLEAAAQERTQDVPSYAKLQWLIVLFTDSSKATESQAKTHLDGLEMRWFTSFSARWRRHAALTKSA